MFSTIPGFFSHKSVLVTGATGFVGKAVVEKIIRCCPDVSTVYVLIRPKKGTASIRERFQALLESRIFDRIRSQNVDHLRKIVAVEGDISLPDLGLKEPDEVRLTSYVSVIIHCAATIRFDEQLRTAYNLNVLATRRMIKFARRVTRLESFVHLSTAYANCDLEVAEEKVYETLIDADCVQMILDDLTDDKIESGLHKILGDRPNTYTLTKAIAENVLVNEGRRIPICIIRPSIITAAMNEPVPGWVDNMYNFTGVVLASGKAVLRTLLCDTTKVGDLVPLDYVVNLIMAAAWHTARTRPKEIPVYHCSTGNDNPIQWGRMEALVLNELRKNPYSLIAWYPGGSIKQDPTWNWFVGIFMHDGVAILADSALRVFRQQPLLKRVQKRIKNSVGPLQFFLLNEWKFKTDNMYALHAQLSPEDRKNFNFDVKRINWKKFVKRYCRGVRRFVVGDADNTIVQSRKLRDVLHLLDVVLKFFGLYVLFLIASFALEILVPEEFLFLP